MTEVVDWQEAHFAKPDKRYKLIRGKIEGTSPNSPSFDTKLKNCKKLVLKNPTDPFSQFCYCYTAYWMSKKSLKGPLSLSNVSQALERIPYPYDIEIARLRFLVDSSAQPLKTLKVVRRRLIKNNPNDYDVNFQMINTLDVEKSLAERSEAISIAKKLISLKHGEAAPYSSMGWIYFRIWLVTHQNQDKNKSVNYYNIYINLSPKNTVFSSQARKKIALMKKTD